MEKNETGLVCLLAEQAAESTALSGPGLPSLSYAVLRGLIDTTNRKLTGAGLHRGDRVALVISNGPCAASAFLSIASGHICAPLNPAYRASEFEFYFSDLKPKAIIIEAGLENAAAGVAEKLQIPVFPLHPLKNAAAGEFTLDTGSEAAERADFAAADEIALVLHTSGTTSRPKIVPLTHANLLENAHNIARSLQLVPRDRCLNVMPLFHVHGLIGALLSSLSAGASVYCSPGFQVTEFFSNFEDCSPTWYTAVPTMHQSVLVRAPQNREIIARSGLRFIRSCSSALPPRVMADLEEVFRVPVVEAYGMTEGSHQIACNPLPPASRKPGSVGVATGPEIAIMGPEGDLLAPMASGEIVIRGRNVTHGYANNPQANDSAFQAGWFRTGDQGYLDPEGYLFINGRTKEMINRGGEKICPREIDEALMEHPAVRQAVAFSLPDTRLGEDVGAAVVLREGAETSESELRQFVSSRLADFKVPRKIVFITEIPKGPTGKLQRIGLAEKLGLTASVAVKPSEFVEPRSQTEVRLAGIWRQVLRIDRVGTQDSFFDLGGDSSAAAQMLAQIEKAFGMKLEPAALFEAPSIAQLAGLLRDCPSVRPRVSTVQSGGKGASFFCVHGHPLFRQLAQHVATDGAFLTLVPPAVEDLHSTFTLENLAAHHVQSLREFQPTGPYYLGGWCNDGVIAYEIAQQLVSSGAEVGGVILFDTRNPGASGLPASQGGRPSTWERMRYHLARLSQTPAEKWSRYLGERCRTLRILLGRKALRIGYSLNLLNDRRVSSIVRDVDHIVGLTVASYHPAPYSGRVVLVRPEDRARSLNEDQSCGWSSLVPDLHIHEVPGNHRTMFLPPNVEITGSILCEMMDGEMPTVAPALHAAGRTN